jgi:hypothetical protein
MMAGAAMAFGSTAANASLAIISCTPTSCSVDNTNFPTSATISWSDANVGSSPFSGTIDFSNTVAGNYFASLTTADPSVFFTSLTVTPITGTGSFSYSGGPTHSITLLPGSLGIGSYALNFGGTTTDAGGEAGTLSFFSAVPEPSTWALMLLGFGGIGFAMRRQRAKAVLPQIA